MVRLLAGEWRLIVDASAKCFDGDMWIALGLGIFGTLCFVVIYPVWIWRAIRCFCTQTHSFVVDHNTSFQSIWITYELAYIAMATQICVRRMVMSLVD